MLVYIEFSVGIFLLGSYSCGGELGSRNIVLVLILWGASVLVIVIFTLLLYSIALHQIKEKEVNH